jgi:hypothetical protein
MGSSDPSDLANSFQSVSIQLPIKGVFIAVRHQKEKTDPRLVSIQLPIKGVFIVRGCGWGWGWGCGFNPTPY